MAQDTLFSCITYQSDTICKEFFFTIISLLNNTARHTWIFDGLKCACAKNVHHSVSPLACPCHGATSRSPEGGQESFRRGVWKWLSYCMHGSYGKTYKSPHLCIKSAYLKKFFVNTVKFPVFVGVSFSLGECYVTLYECAVGAICKIDILLKILDELNCFRKIILNFNH